jgi:hypothetical protein
MPMEVTDQTPARHKKHRVLPKKAEESLKALIPPVKPHPIKIAVIAEEDETQEADAEKSGFQGEMAGAGQWSETGQ